MSRKFIKIELIRGEILAFFCRLIDRIVGEVLIHAKKNKTNILRYGPNKLVIKAFLTRLF